MVVPPPLRAAAASVFAAAFALAAAIATLDHEDFPGANLNRWDEALVYLAAQFIARATL